MRSPADEVAALYALARQDNPYADSEQLAVVIVERMGEHRAALPDVRRFVDVLETAGDE